MNVDQGERGSRRLVYQRQQFAAVGFGDQRKFDFVVFEVSDFWLFGQGEEGCVGRELLTLGGGVPLLSGRSVILPR